MKPAKKFNILVILSLFLLLWVAINKVFYLVATLSIILIGLYLMLSLTRKSFKRILVRIKSKLRRKT